MLPSSLSAPRTKALASAIVATAAAALFVGPASHAHASGCAPVANTPFVSGGSGIAEAFLPCGGTYEIYLRNAAGTTLGSPNSGTLNSGGPVSTGSIRCAGAIVHTFVWVNVNGSVSSDTSGSVQC